MNIPTGGATMSHNYEDVRRAFLELVEQIGVEVFERVRPSSSDMEELERRRNVLMTQLYLGAMYVVTNTPLERVTRLMLGGDLIVPQEIQRVYDNLVYSREQLALLKRTFPSDETIWWCHNNDYMLVAGPPRTLSLQDMRALRPQYFYRQSGKCWFDEHSFSKSERVPLRWLKIRKDATPETQCKGMDQQRTLLSEREVIPTAAEVVWATMVYKSVRHINLFTDTYVRTASIGDDGMRVHVGGNGTYGIGIGRSWDNDRHKYVGLATART
jgi:hypothetical protein